MTISLSDNTPRISYTVNEGATQTAFTVPFEFFAGTDLNFYVDGTKKTITTHYTVFTWCTCQMCVLSVVCTRV